MRDLPITIDLPAPLAAEVRAWAEGDLGWQVVEGAGPLQPALRITAHPEPGSVVVVAGEVTAADVRDALRGGVVDVVVWPQERARLAAAAAHHTDGPTAAVVAGSGAAVLRLGGAAGGVGCSTVALGLGGIAAWAGRTALVVGGDDLTCLAGVGRWDGPGTAELALLGPDDAAAEVPRLARGVPAVPGLSVLGATADPGALTSERLRGWPAALVVVDAGVAAADADLLVARPDAGLLRHGGGAAPLLVNGAGPLSRTAVERAWEAAVIGWLPASVRVGRAGATGRVPAGLPGTWLAALRAAAVPLGGTQP